MTAENTIATDLTTSLPTKMTAEVAHLHPPIPMMNSGAKVEEKAIIVPKKTIIINADITKRLMAKVERASTGKVVEGTGDAVGACPPKTAKGID